MQRVAELYSCVSENDDDEADQKIVSQWYAVAASFGNDAAEKRYTDITGSTLSDKEKRWIRNDFIKYRKTYLEK